jgi:singapore isolate B (sub-type 7) whole genome shotgun sequence assembly, scaffold_5
LKDVDEMIQEKDLDQDGRINFDEFLKIITRDASSLGSY